MKKIYLVFLAMLFAGLSFGQNKSATIDAGEVSSITTTYAAGNGGVDGTMFDVTTFGRPLTIESIDLNLFSTGTSFTLDIYIKDGTYVGDETNSAAWTKVATGTGVSAGLGNASSVDITDFELPANSLTGFYVNTDIQNTQEDVEGIVYTTGANTYSNEDLQLNLGAGVFGDFGVIGGIWTPRTWNGAIHYSSFDCIEDVFVDNDAGECSAIVNYLQRPTWAAATVTQIDNSGLTSGDVFPLGTTTQSYELDWGTIKDTCTFTITVNDVEAPSVICKDITVQLDAFGNASILVTDIDNGSTDNCGIASLGFSPASFTCANVGPNTVTLTVVDVNGNQASCTSTVTVEDNVNPTALCKDITVQLDASGNASILETDIDNGSSDNCGLASLVASPAIFTNANLGDNQVTLTALDINGNSSTCTAIVTIVDDTAPIVICNSIDVYLDKSGRYILTPTDLNDLTAGTTDNVDAYSDLIIFARPLSFYCEDAGAVKVDLVVEDSEGNRGYCRTLVNVIDTASLEIETVMDVFVETEPGVCETKITYPEISANTCATLSQTEGLGADGIFPVGTNVETWKAIGLNGDSVMLSFNVVVSSLNAAPAIDTIADLQANENSAVVNVPLSGISYGIDCLAQEITLSALSQNAALIAGIVVNYSSPDSTGSLDISLINDEIGNDTITVTVTDSEGAMISETFVLTINPINKQPIIDEIADVEVQEDSPLITIPLSGISYGNDGEEQTVSITANGINAELVDTIVVNYSSPDSTGSLELSLLPDVFGVDTISVTLMDNMGGSVSESFVLEVTPVNDAPYLLHALVDGKVNASYPFKLSLTTLMGVVFDDIDDEMLEFDAQIEGTDGLPAWAVIESDVLTALPMIADTGSYSFVIYATDAEGATVSDIFMLVVEGYPTAIEDFDQEKFEVIMYPNPSIGEVNLKINSSEIMDAEVVVRSITGSEVFRKEYKGSEQIKFDLSDQVSGIYLITLQQGNNSVIKKFILDRK